MPYQKGHKHSEETKKKMSLSGKGKKKPESFILYMKKRFRDGFNPMNFPGAKEKMIKSLTGFKHSEKTKKLWSEQRKGKNHPNWKGGITPEIVKIRNSLEMKQWIFTVLKKYNFTCLNCGQYGGKLVAHHIKAFSDYPKLRFNLDNGITLCRDCHEI